MVGRKRFDEFAATFEALLVQLESPADGCPP